MGHRCIRHHGIQCCTVSPVFLMPWKDGLLADQLHLSVSYSSMRIQGHCVQEDSNCAKLLGRHIFSGSKHACWCSCWLWQGVWLCALDLWMHSCSWSLETWFWNVSILCAVVRHECGVFNLLHSTWAAVKHGNQTVKMPYTWLRWSVAFDCFPQSG